MWRFAPEPPPGLSGVLTLASTCFDIADGHWQVALHRPSYFLSHSMTIAWNSLRNDDHIPWKWLPHPILRSSVPHNSGKWSCQDHCKFFAQLMFHSFFFPLCWRNNSIARFWDASAWWSLIVAHSIDASCSLRSWLLNLATAESVPNECCSVSPVN